MDEVPCVEQATCTNSECDGERAEFKTYDRDLNIGDSDTEPHTTRHVRCRSCGSTATIRVTEHGTEGIGDISFEHASWNKGDDDDE